MTSEKTQKYKNDKILARITNLMIDLVCISVVVFHRFNEKVSYFCHTSFDYALSNSSKKIKILKTLEVPSLGKVW